MLGVEPEVTNRDDARGPRPLPKRACEPILLWRKRGKVVFSDNVRTGRSVEQELTYPPANPRSSITNVPEGVSSPLCAGGGQGSPPGFTNYKSH